MFRITLPHRVLNLSPPQMTVLRKLMAVTTRRNGSTHKRDGAGPLCQTFGLSKIKGMLRR